MEKSKMNERLFLWGALGVYLIGVGIYEYRMILILDVVVLGGLAYFLPAAFLLSSKRWYDHLLGGLILFLMMLFAAVGYYEILGEDYLGGGTIKLASVIGLVLGVRKSFLTGAIFLLSQAVLVVLSPLFTFDFLMPSVPIYLVSIFLTWATLSFSKKKESLHPTIS